MPQESVTWWENLLASNRASIANQCSVCLDYRRQLLEFAKSKGDAKELAREKARKRSEAYKRLKTHLQVDSNHPIFVPLVALPTRIERREEPIPAPQAEVSQEEWVFLQQLQARTEEGKLVHFVGPSTMGSNSGAGEMPHGLTASTCGTTAWFVTLQAKGALLGGSVRFMT